MEYTTQTFKGKGYTATVYRPILSDAERAKREQYIINTLRHIGREVAKREAIKRELLLKDRE